MALIVIQEGSHSNRVGGGMGRKKRTEITMETDQVTVIYRPRDFVRAWCEGCAEEVGMVTAEQAAAISGIGPRAIYQAVEADALHFVETADRVLFICPKSLNALKAATATIYKRKS